MSQLIATLIAGIAQGMPLFLVASGLTLIFGVMHVLNFAHGAFFMLGAYVLVSLLGGSSVPFVVFLLASFAATAVVGAVGGASEMLVFRKLYQRQHFITLLATYALLLVLEGGAQQLWGVLPRTQRTSSEVKSAVDFLGARVPVYDLVLILAGVLVAVFLYLLMQRSRFGRMLRAVAEDSSMARALGVPARRIQIWVFVIGSALAGLSGALTAPLVSIDTGLAPLFILQSFAVVIIGGLGSLSGALVGALLLGMMESVLVSYWPEMSGFSLYIAVAAALLFRPQGLFGRKTSTLEAA